MRISPVIAFAAGVAAVFAYHKFVKPVASSAGSNY